MKKFFFLFLLLSSSVMFISAQVKVQNLLCENKKNPTGIDVMQPRFTWQLNTPARNVMQAAYEIRTSTDAASLKQNKNILWNSGKITSDQSVQVPYGGGNLKAATNYAWQVRVWDNTGKGSAWSEPATWQEWFDDDDRSSIPRLVSFLFQKRSDVIL